MQAIITNLLLGMAENLKTTEKKAQVQNNEASPFMQLLQTLQNSAEKETEMGSVFSMKDRKEPLSFFLDEARKEIKEFIGKGIPIEKTGGPLQLEKVPFHKMKMVNLGLFDAETEGEKTEPGILNKEKSPPGKVPENEEKVILKNRGEDPKKQLFFSREEQIKKPILEDKGPIIRGAIQAKKVKSPQPNIFLQVTEHGGKSIPLASEGSVFAEGEPLQDQSGTLKMKSFFPGQEKMEVGNNNSPLGEKLPTQMHSGNREDNRFSLFSGFQQGNNSRKNSFGQTNERPTDFQFDPFQNYHRPETRPPNIEAARTIDASNRTPDVFQQIVDQARLTLRNREEGTMEIKLRPEYLGGLRMKVVLEDGQFRAHFQVENHLARDILENNLTNLRDNLSRVGFTFDDVDVNVQGEGSESSGQREGEFAEKNSGREDTPEVVEESLYSILEKNEVDYRV